LVTDCWVGWIFLQTLPCETLTSGNSPGEIDLITEKQPVIRLPGHYRSVVKIRGVRRRSVTRLTVVGRKAKSTGAGQSNINHDCPSLVPFYFLLLPFALLPIPAPDKLPSPDDSGRSGQGLCLSYRPSILMLWPRRSRCQEL